MIKHAWSLVFFTVLGQLGAGLYLVYKIVFFNNRIFSSGVQPNSKSMLIISLVLSALALMISFSHLGHPKNAIFALSNFKNSWLSREIFFLAAFIGLMIVELVFAKGIAVSNAREIFISATGIVASLLFVFSMIRLYQLETVPVWNSRYTFFNFYNSALLGGILIFMLISSGREYHALIYSSLILIVFQIIIFYSSAYMSVKISYLPILFYSLFLLTLLTHLFGVFSDRGKFVVYLFTALFFGLGILAERYIFYLSFKSAGI